MESFGEYLVDKYNRKRIVINNEAYQLSWSSTKKEYRVGKALANGFTVSVVVSRAEWLRLLEH